MIADVAESTKPASYQDVRLFLENVEAWKTKGRLYNLDEQDFFNPSSGVYKYPPTYAAMLRPLTSPALTGQEPIYLLLALNAVILAAGLGVILALFRPGRERLLLVALVFLNWQPFQESMGGPQVEPLMMLILALGLVAMKERRAFLAGAAVGVAGALKVYPFGLGAYFALRRDWKAMLGVAAGAVFALGAASIVLDPHLTVQYFTQILPKLGGTSLGWENISLPGNIGRLILLLGQGWARMNRLASYPYGTVEGCGMRGARAALIASEVVFGLGLIGLTVLRLRGCALGARTSLAVFGASLCLLLLLMPTSWPDYQTMLILPAATGLLLAPSFRRDPPCWILLIAAVLAEAISMNAHFFDYREPWVPLVRAWVPLALWAALMRVSRGNFDLDLPAACPTL